MSLAESRQASSEHKRYLVCVLLDCSQSMGTSQGQRGSLPIDALNEAMPEFLTKDLLEVGPLAQHGEIAVGRFFGTARPVEWQRLSASHDPASNPFYRIASGLRLFQPLTAEGETPMGTAILDGLKYVEARRTELTTAERPVSVPHRPAIFLISDGEPQGESAERLQEACQELQRAENAREVLFWSVATDGANKSLLETLSVGGADNTFDLSGATMREVLRLVSVTVGSVMTGGVESSLEGKAGESRTLGQTFNLSSDPEDPRRIYREVAKTFQSEKDFYARGREQPYGK